MSKIDSALPSYVNDSGTGRDGTREDVTFYDAWRDAINGQTYSATNPTITPADTIDEVVTARGSLGSLDGRLDVEHNEDGTHKSTGVIGTFVTQVQLMGGLGGVNLLTDDDFLCWHLGDSAAPLSWNLAGAGASIVRCGTGLGDTNNKIGDFCAKVTRGGTNVTLSNTLIESTAYTRAQAVFEGNYISFGCWVLCSTPNVARLAVSDNVGTTYSSYHTGGGTWEFLGVARQISNSGTAVIVACCVHNADLSAYFSGATALLLTSNFVVTQYQPSPVNYGAVKFGVAGNLAGATQIDSFEPGRGGIVKYVQCYVKTAPTGQAIIFDVNTWDGAALTSMFSTKPQIAATVNRGGAAPDGTYARRCLSGTSGSSIVAGGLVTLDVDQVGSGTTGADASVEVRILQYASPLERFQST